MTDAAFVLFLKNVVQSPKRMVKVMRENDLKVCDLGDPMEKLAFTMYCELCSLAQRAEVLLEEMEEDNGDS